MSRNHSRRSFALLVGSAVATGLAGCSSGSSGNATNQTETGMGTTAGNMTTAGNATMDGNATTDGNATSGTTMAGPETTTTPATAIANGKAAVRIAHLSPDAPKVDVAVDDQTVLSGVSYGTVSDYLVLDPGSHHVQVTPSGGTTAVFDQDVSVDAAGYTAAAIGEVAGQNQPFGVTLFTDDVEPPAAGTGRARLIHAAPDAPAVDVTVKGANQTLFENVAFGEASDYAEAPAGSYTLEVRPHTANNDGVVTKTFDVTLEGGAVVTGFAVGYLSPDTAPAKKPFDLLLRVDSKRSS